MLAGANRAWPYTVAGASSGTLFLLGVNTEVNVGSPSGNGLFCRNCHPRPSSGQWNNSSNPVHDTVGWGHLEPSGGSGNNCPNGCRECVRCHLRVPHGGKVSRLIVTSNAPARYRVPGIPPLFDGFQKLEIEGAESAFSVAPNNYTPSYSPCAGRHGGSQPLESW
jgi:hypothetical protein